MRFHYIWLIRRSLWTSSHLRRVAVNLISVFCSGFSSSVLVSLVTMRHYLSVRYKVDLITPMWGGRHHGQNGVLNYRNLCWWLTYHNVPSRERGLNSCLEWFWLTYDFNIPKNYKLQAEGKLQPPKWKVAIPYQSKTTNYMTILLKERFLFPMK